MKIHIVKKGDTLYELSKKYGVPLVKIVDANPQLVDPNKLDIGMKIKVPTEPVPVPDGTQPIIHKHAVKQGDSLWKLSKAWGVSLKEIIDANPQLKNPNALLVGEVVNIPSSGTFTNTGDSHHTGGTGNVADKTVPGSKTYTGPKEEMTAPQPTLPEIPQVPVLPEVEIMPEVNVMPEVTVIPEIVVKPEITIMPELIVMPELPKVMEKPMLPPMEPVYEPEPQMMEPICPEKPIAPVIEPCPPFPEYPVHCMPQPFDCFSPEFMFPTAPQHMFPEAPCGCHENVAAQPEHDWCVPEHHYSYPHYTHKAEHDTHKEWMAPTSHYPGITEQPMAVEYSQISITEPYMTGTPSYTTYPTQVEMQQPHTSYEAVMGMGYKPEKMPCGCHGGTEMPTPYGEQQVMADPPNWNPMYPHHHSHHYHHHHGDHGHYPTMPSYGGTHQSYPWSQGAEGTAETMGSSAMPHGAMEFPMPYGSMGYPMPWKEHTKGYPEKDCGCHGRQDEQKSIDVLKAEPAFDNGISINSADVANMDSNEDRLEGFQAEAKVSREEEIKVKAKSVTKKTRKQISKPKRKNPWIKR